MRAIKFLAVMALLAVPALAQADVATIPGSSTWYFHADFAAMREGKASQGLYAWLDAEVFEELREEIGVDFDKEVRYLTAFSRDELGPVIIIDGAISQETKDKIIAFAAIDGELQPFKAAGKTYYYFEGDPDDSDTGDIDIDIESLEEEAYVSVALKNKIVITHSREQMEILLENNGKLPNVKKDKDTLFVLKADRSLMQAGVNAERLQDAEEDDWDSNILSNTKQVALLLADLGDKLGFEAQLMTTEPEMAESLASIVRGLISLQAFNDDMDAEVSSALQSARVNVAGSTLSIALALDPNTVASALAN